MGAYAPVHAVCTSMVLPVLNQIDVACQDTDMLLALCNQESLIDHPGFW